MKETHRRKGYMEEAIKVPSQFGFGNFKLKSAEAFTEAKNTPSVNLLLKLGFENTGKKYGKYSIFRLLQPY